MTLWSETPPVCSLCNDRNPECSACGDQREGETEPQHEERPHLSVSQINMHARCPIQWYFRYAMGIRSPPGVALVIGKGVDQTVTADLEQKMAWGSLLSTEEVRDRAADATRGVWQKDPPVVTDTDPTLGGAVDIAVGLAELHHREAAPSIEPIALQHTFLIELPQLTHDVLGVVDVETATDIRDTKTAKKSPAANAAKRSDQLVAYHLRATLDGHPEKTVALDYLVKTKVPRYVPIEATPGPRDHLAFLRRVELITRSIKSGVFTPPDPATSYWCSERFCGYWDRCEFGARQTVSVGLVDPAHLTSRIIANPHDETPEDTAPGEE